MKARVKATGEIVEIVSGVICIDKNGYKQTIHSDFIEPYIDINADNDYWEKLHHQAAIAAMQGIMTNIVGFESVRNQRNASEVAAGIAIDYATALVNKLKEEQK